MKHFGDHFAVCGGRFSKSVVKFDPVNGRPVWPASARAPQSQGKLRAASGVRVAKVANPTDAADVEVGGLNVSGAVCSGLPT